jgi:hypothetical protein
VLVDAEKTACASTRPVCSETNRLARSKMFFLVAMPARNAPKGGENNARFRGFKKNPA